MAGIPGLDFVNSGGMVMMPANMVTILYIVAFLGIFMFIGSMLFLKSNIPEIVALLKSHILKRPWVHVHTSLNQLEFYAPKRSGEKADENTYDMDKYLGVKLVPDPATVENSVNGRRIVHYYSKAAPSFTAKQAAACRDVTKTLKEKGIEATESVIDNIFIASDNELNTWYADNPEALKIIKEIKDELSTTFIEDGQFVWQTVEDFINVSSIETARALEEFKSIAHEQADEMYRNTGKPKDMRETVVYALVLIVGMAVAYKIMAG